MLSRKKHGHIMSDIVIDELCEDKKGFSAYDAGCGCCSESCYLSDKDLDKVKDYKERLLKQLELAEKAIKDFTKRE